VRNLPCRKQREQPGRAETSRSHGGHMMRMLWAAPCSPRKSIPPKTDPKARHGQRLRVCSICPATNRSGSPTGIVLTTTPFWRLAERLQSLPRPLRRRLRRAASDAAAEVRHDFFANYANGGADVPGMLVGHKTSSVASLRSAVIGLSLALMHRPTHHQQSAGGDPASRYADRNARP
jgi:hypothetical protein